MATHDTEIETLFVQLESAQQTGDLDKQIDIYRQLLSFCQQYGNGPGEIEALRRLGNLYQYKGNLQKAHAYRLAAMELLEDPRSNCDPEERMSVIGDLGRSFLEANDWQKAEIYTQQALEMAKGQCHKMGECIYKINLQLILANTGRIDQVAGLAEEVLRDGETLSDEPDGQKNYVLGLQHMNLASFQLAEMHLNESQRHARKALAYAERARDPAMGLRCQQILGKSYVRARLVTGKREYSAEAEEHLYEAIRTGQIGGDSWTIAEAEAELGRLYEYRRIPDHALDHYQHALNLLETVRNGLGYEEFQITYFRSIQPVYENMITCFLKQKKTSAAFQALERLRSRLLLTDMGEKRASSNRWTPEAQEELHRILDRYGDQAVRQVYGDGSRGKRRGITWGMRAVSSGEATDANLSETVDARQDFVRLYDQQHVQQSNWTTHQSPPVVELEEAQNILSPEDALLIYWVARDSVIIFAVTRHSCHFQQLTYSVKQMENVVDEINRAIFSLQDWVLDPLNVAEWFARSDVTAWPIEVANRMALLIPKLEKAFALLIAPVLPIVSGQRHWIIVPSGPLHQLPWAALRTPRQYLVENHSLSLLPSTSAGAVLKKRPLSTNGGAVFLADPDPDDWGFALPASQVEVKAACESLKLETELLIGPQATKANLLAHLAKAQLIHLACHHVFDARTPMLSFLKLAGNSGANNLYAFEINEFNLTADLVALSACQSGRSHADTGDEQYGIVRAFLAAGVQSVISTLWSIEDESAATFFNNFYQMVSQQSVCESLRQAQLALLKDPRYCLPTFWAPYTLSGRWERPLRN